MSDQALQNMPVQAVIQTDGKGYPIGTQQHPLYFSLAPALIANPAGAAGAAVAAAAETSLLPAAAVASIPANFWQVGRTIRIRAAGIISSVITTPGTARFKVKMGATAVFDGLAILLDDAVAHANKGWELEILLACRAIGANANLWGQGRFWSEDIKGQAAMPVGCLTAMLPWNATPAVGANFDSTIAQALDLTFTQTVATGSIQLQTYSVELVGG
jgi:hypothetical protein